MKLLVVMEEHELYKSQRERVQLFRNYRTLWLTRLPFSINKTNPLLYYHVFHSELSSIMVFSVWQTGELNLTHTHTHAHTHAHTCLGDWEAQIGYFCPDVIALNPKNTQEHLGLNAGKIIMDCAMTTLAYNDTLRKRNHPDMNFTLYWERKLMKKKNRDCPWPGRLWVCVQMAP